MLLGKVDQLQLANGTSTVKFPIGKLSLPKGVKMNALYLKCVVSLANASGGAVTLSAAQKRTLLNLFQLTLKLGVGGKLSQPYVAQGFNEIRRMARRCFHSEIEGWSDSTTGLENQLANGATETVTFYLPIPLGKLAALKGRFKNMWGVGPSLAQLLQFEIRQTGSTVLTGVTVTATTTFDVMPFVVPQKGDVVSPLPVIENQTEARKFADFTEGLPLSISETSAVQASAASTSTSLRIDGAEVYTQLPASEVIIAHSDAENLPSAGQLTDEETLLYYAPYVGDVDFSVLPTGKAKWVQDVKDIATASLTSFIVPIIPDAQLVANIDYIANEIREKRLKAVSYADVYGLRVPDNLKPFVPFVLFDEDDKEFQLFAGIVAGPGMEPVYEVPATLKERVKRAVAAHKAAGEDLAAEATVKAAASMAPGAVQSARGFAQMGSNILANARRILA